MKVFKSKEEQQTNIQSLNNRLKQDREKLGLTIEQVFSATNVRHNVIVGIENNTPIDLPAPYIKAFIAELNEFYEKAKTDADYLKFVKTNATKQEILKTSLQDTENIVNKYTNNNNISEKIEKNENIEIKEYETETVDFLDSFQINGQPIIEKQIINDNQKEIRPTIDFPAEKQKIKTTGQTKAKFLNKILFKNSLNLSVRDTIIYAVIILFLFSVIFFIFIYEESEIKNDDITAVQTDSEIVDAKVDNMFGNFNEKQDIILRAVCKDTAWVKVEIDNQKNYEILMKPGMETSWTAKENIILTTSNVGAIAFYKNDTLFPQLGAKGTMVNNIKITQDGITGVSPLTRGSQTIPIDSANPSQINIIPSVADTNKVIAKQRANIRRKKKEEPKPIIIDLSPATPTKSPVLENKQTEEKQSSDNR